jgi:hypothetical protein
MCRDLALDAPAVGIVERLDHLDSAVEEHLPERPVHAVVALANVQRVDVRAVLGEPQPHSGRGHLLAVSGHMAEWIDQRRAARTQRLETAHLHHHRALFAGHGVRHR